MEIIFNKTKIVATLGPASNSEEGIEKLINAGVDVFRLNFSHGEHDLHGQVIERINAVNQKLGTFVCKLQDLQGPKIRVEEVENNGVEITPGQELTISIDKVTGSSERVSTSYQNLVHDVEPGETILVDDGKIELKALRKTDKEVVCEVIYGGILKSRKGINLPDTAISSPSLTEKDRKDLEFGLEAGVDWIALSFVRTADDIREIKQIIAEKGKKVKVVAKIEKPEAVRNIDEIIEVTDGIMVARGDLGVEMLAEEVPIIQKMIVEKCNDVGKPVIVATQMLESMIDNPRPTRAEVNDVANAVMDGADAIMLSAESAAGKYPIESVETMVRTAGSVERDASSIYHKNYDLEGDSPTFFYDNVVASACKLASDTNSRAIIGMTKSGYTANQIARHRPTSDIFIFTENENLLYQLGLIWGVRGFKYEKVCSVEETVEDFKNILKDRKYLESGDIFIHTGAMPRGQNLRTNLIKLSVVD